MTSTAASAVSDLSKASLKMMTDFYKNFPSTYGGTYLVRSKAERPFAGLLSAKRVEIDRFLSFDPQVPFKM